MSLQEFGTLQIALSVPLLSNHQTPLLTIRSVLFIRRFICPSHLLSVVFKRWRKTAHRFGPLMNAPDRKLGQVLTLSSSIRQKLFIKWSLGVTVNNGQHDGKTREGTSRSRVQTGLQ